MAGLFVRRGIVQVHNFDDPAMILVHRLNDAGGTRENSV